MSNEITLEEFEEMKRHLGEENFKVVVGSEAEELSKKLDGQKKIELPPKPEGILPWSEEESRSFKYTAFKDVLKTEDTKKRLQFKLYNVWSLWGCFRNNTRLSEVLNKLAEDQDSEEFLLKCSLVIFIDKIGKILDGDTDILEEFQT